MIQDKTHTQFPSRFNIEEEVTLRFPGHRDINHCFIHAVHFTNSKVKYDINIPIIVDLDIPENTDWTRIYNVDSYFVVDSI